MKQNPFSFYTGKDYNQANAECTKKLKALWKKFAEDWISIRESYQNVGTTDTASRETQIGWVQKKADELI